MPIGESDSAITKSARSSFGGDGGGRAGDECAPGGEVGRYAPGRSLSCGKLSAARDVLVNAMRGKLSTPMATSRRAREDEAWLGEVERTNGLEETTREME
jgi:hypothetical protein